ncbi:MAG: T9SS type A sorting domain-containing protein [Tannerella sp.]|jgi:hypothetical protein|nr:T9SS type A sorting domain-containing protein [Tannerella sp.]
MIQKYTGLILIALTLLFTVGGEKMCAMSGADYYAMDTVRGNTDFPFQQDDPLIEDYTIWAANSSVYIRANKDVEVNIYTITGQLSKRMKVTAGETSISMARGLYIVRVENITRKVIVR